MDAAARRLFPAPAFLQVFLQKGGRMQFVKANFINENDKKMRKILVSFSDISAAFSIDYKMEFHYNIA